MMGQEAVEDRHTLRRKVTLVAREALRNLKNWNVR
jgi:hypothetical protein